MHKEKYASRLKSKLIEMQALNLNDSEIERCFKNTVLANKNINTAKTLRDKGVLKI